MRLLFGTILALAVVGDASAQSASVPAAPAPVAKRPVSDTSVFAPLPMPTANEYRTGGGAPGSRYWQNRADYDLSAVLDTATKTLAGRLRMTYHNNSPDTLRFLWVQMEQNAFQDNSLNSLIFPQESRFGARGFEGGDVIERFEQVLPGAARGAERTVAVKRRENGTMTRVDLAQPLAPGGRAVLDVAWHFLIPEHGADRMGRDGALYELAQWYPRVAVYDDVAGWNTEPYLGQGEFYLEYGDYALAVTVPAGYIVAATGALQNPEEVLTPLQRTRLAAAARTDTVVRVVTAAELSNGTARPRSTGTLTWKFAARDVRDAVWAAAPDYQWDATSYQGAYAFAYYRPSAAVNWHDAADQSRMSLDEYSERWFPYPWPQISAVEGPISGMEYPMVAMENKSSDVQDLYNVLTHEIGHMWFPMIVGSNERLYMWQDEGFNTFINTFSEGRRYPAQGDQMARAAGERTMVERYMVRGFDEPIIVEPDRVNQGLLGIADYVKPSVGLQLLRQEILGPETFDDAFREYTRRWAFKHPTPYDFFRTMEDVSGRRLDWFWRTFIFENARFDQAIDTAAVRQVGDTAVAQVRYGNRERGVLPIRVRFTFHDGTTQDFQYPAEVWSTNTAHYLRRYVFPGKSLAKIELDPEGRLIDVDRTNNTWTPPPPAADAARRE
ncbi:MAG: M1 family peptidase [Gemmatimonadetes bacterium]|nr:M1 family peptidase [Gemmatimonadota bacterium]